MSESDLSSSEEGRAIKLAKLPSKTPKRKFTNRFRVSKLNDNDLKPWLMRSNKGDMYFNCTFWKTDYLGGISAAKKHGKSEKDLSLIRTRKIHYQLIK